MGPRMTWSESARWAAVDSAVEAEAAAAFAFLERLVAAPSTVGAERGAQEIVTAELARLGFEVSEFEVPAQTAAAPPGGVAQRSYRGRPNVLGQLNQGRSPSLLLNGHVDVVPSDPALRASEPFELAATDGWLSARAAPQLKGGFPSGLLGTAA